MLTLYACEAAPWPDKEDYGRAPDNDYFLRQERPRRFFRSPGWQRLHRSGFPGTHKSQPWTLHGMALVNLHLVERATAA